MKGKTLKSRQETKLAVIKQGRVYARHHLLLIDRKARKETMMMDLPTDGFVATNKAMCIRVINFC